MEHRGFDRPYQVSARRREAVALAVALLALSILDLVITETAVRHLGAVELNPLVAPLLGTGWAPLVKVGLPVLIIVLASRIRTPLVFGALRSLVALYLAVAVFTMGQFVAAVA